MHSFLIHFDSLAQNQIDVISDLEAKSFRAAKSFSSTYNYENADIHYTRCEWKVDPAVNFISGNITSYFQAHSFLDSITFDCSQYLTIDSVTYHGSQISFLHDSDLIKIYFPAFLSANSLDSLSVYYHGAPVSTGNGSFEQSLHNGDPVMWTLSEPYGAKDWWPCRQNNADKIDSIDVWCEIPLGTKCASNGILVSAETAGVNMLYHWKSNYPIAPYLVAIAVTNYAEFSDSVVLSNSDTLPILNYIYPEQISVAQPAFSVTASLISYYDSLLVSYPFSKEKYGHAQFGWGGGMEHQTMSFVGSFGYELIAHELVHQWFGDKITCSSWRDIWLHEGFATFFAGAAIERFKPEEYYAWKYSALQSIISKPTGSVICSDTTDRTRIFDGRLSYRKGSYVLNMLRWKFGEELFLESIRDFLNKNSLQYNYATTEDLKLSFEFITGSDLTEFFDEWVYGEGYPSFKIEWSKSGNSVTMIVDQVSSDPGISFFHIPLPVQIGNAERDSIVIIDATSSGQQFNFELDFEPDFISIDPNLEIISGNNKLYENLPPGSIEDLIAIFPNPSNGILDVFAKKNSLMMKSFSVLDYCGKLLYSQNVKNGFNDTFDLSFLNNGLYILKISTDLGFVHKKIIIQK
ncbi:MAG: T9SS type A sorting domain-containing protein [Bacteroidetes bacterium]|nr:T9SS type A sorting domain-containing protein [Bacteroidota bacterium]